MPSGSNFIARIKGDRVPIELSGSGCGDNVEKWRARLTHLERHQKQLSRHGAAVVLELKRIEQRREECIEAIESLEATE